MAMEILACLPAIVAGKVNLNSVYRDPNNRTLAPVGQPILAGAGWDANSSQTVVASGAGGANRADNDEKPGDSDVDNSHAE